MFYMVEYERRENIIAEAWYIIDNNATLREAEKHFGVSRSTINRDIAVRLPRINPDLAERANAVLHFNKEFNRQNIVEVRKHFLEQRQ